MFDLRKFRESFNLTQVDLAAMLGCTQPYITRMEKEYKDLSGEQRKILEDKYGKNTILKYTMSEDALPSDIQTQTPSRRVERDSPDWKALFAEQQQSINQLIDMVKALQAENAKLTDAIIKQKAV